MTVAQSSNLQGPKVSKGLVSAYLMSIHTAKSFLGVRWSQALPRWCQPEPPTSSFRTALQQTHVPSSFSARHTILAKYANTCHASKYCQKKILLGHSLYSCHLFLTINISCLTHIVNAGKQKERPYLILHSHWTGYLIWVPQSQWRWSHKHKHAGCSANDPQAQLCTRNYGSSPW